MRRLQPAGALWTRNGKGQGLALAVAATSVQLRASLEPSWRELFGTSLPGRLELFAGALRRRRFGQARANKLCGPLEVDHAQLELLNLVEFLLELGALQFSLNAETEAPKICDAFVAAMAEWGQRRCQQEPRRGSPARHGSPARMKSRGVPS